MRSVCDQMCEERAGACAILLHVDSASFNQCCITQPAYVVCTFTISIVCSMLKSCDDYYFLFLFFTTEQKNILRIYLRIFACFLYFRVVNPDWFPVDLGYL